MPSKKYTKTTALILAATMTMGAALPVSTANAGGKHKDAIIAAGVIGLALGAIIADSSNHRRRRADHIYYNQPAYVPPQPVPRYNDTYYEPNPDAGAYYDDSYRDDQAAYNQPRVITPPRRNYQQVYQPAPIPPARPKVVRYNDSPAYNTEPWSSGWRSYCRNKFRSFDGKSGTYLGYDGKRHFCVVK